VDVSPATLLGDVFLVGAAVLVVAAAVWMFRRRRSWAMVLGGAMFLGGALGNLIDRALRDGGRVVDFAQIDLGLVSTGVFNVADVFLMAALPIFLFWGNEPDAASDDESGSSSEDEADVHTSAVPA
jgi:signal peptidase II